MKLCFVVIGFVVSSLLVATPLSAIAAEKTSNVHDQFLEQLEIQLINKIAFLNKLISQYGSTTIATSIPPPPQPVTPTIRAVVDYKTGKTTVTINDGAKVPRVVTFSTTKEASVTAQLRALLKWTTREISDRTTFVYKNSNAITKYTFIIRSPRDMELESMTASGITISEKISTVTIDRLIFEEFFGSRSAYENILDGMVKDIREGETPEILIDLLANEFKLDRDEFAKSVTFDVSDY